MKVSTINLIRIKNLNNHSPQPKNFIVKHTMKFATIYLPGTIKDIRLYFRKETGPNSFLDKDYKHKILIKQSYIILVWFYYLSNSHVEPKLEKIEPEVDEEKDIVIPKFFIYPKKNYRTTVQKAPMAHKTFSQEQYMIRYYTLSITFSMVIPEFYTNELVSNVSIYPIKGINNSMYYYSTLFKSLPYVSSNMIWLKKYSVGYLTKDTLYFSYFLFINTK